MDDKITTLTSTINNKISDIDVVDEDFTTGADSEICVLSDTVNSHQNKLLSSYSSNVIEKHFHLLYSGKATGFSITSMEEFPLPP